MSTINDYVYIKMRMANLKFYETNPKVHQIFDF